MPAKKWIFTAARKASLKKAQAAAAAMRRKGAKAATKAATKKYPAAVQKQLDQAKTAQNQLDKASKAYSKKYLSLQGKAQTDADRAVLDKMVRKINTLGYKVDTKLNAAWKAGKARGIKVKLPKY